MPQRALNLTLRTCPGSVMRPFISSFLAALAVATTVFGQSAPLPLDGWDLKAKHNVFNSLTWGPDGWLYGCNGIMSNSRLGRPGTPDAQRVAINCGVWRYHPTRQLVEAVAWGTTNPWGLDFDDYGELFI